MSLRSLRNSQSFQSFEAELALLITTILWALTLPLIRIGMQAMNPYEFVAVRFLFATGLLGPVLFLDPKRRGQILEALPLALSLGSLLFLEYLSQTIGLQTVSSPRGAFITGTYVVFVPLFSLLFGKGLPRVVEIMGVALAMAGLYLLVDPGTGGITSGDLWILLTATLIALHIHLVQRLASKGIDDLVLAFVQILGVAAYSWLSVPFAPHPPIHWGGPMLVSLIVCAWLVTVGTFYLQARYQKKTTPERAALIFSTQPVFATVFGYLILNESLPLRGFLGAGLILASVVGTELSAKRARAQAEKRDVNALVLTT